MDGFSSRPTTSINTADFRFSVHSFSRPSRFNKLFLPPKSKKFEVFASKDEFSLNEWDQMELKFGKMLGEDPKLTMAKIIGRKSNPDMSNLEIEKLFYKKGGKGINYDIKEVSFDGSKERHSSNSLAGLNLVRPVPKKGVKFEVNNKLKASGIKQTPPVVKAEENSRNRVPDIALRKPSVFREDDGETRKPLRSNMQSSLTLNMSKDKAKERFTDMMLIRKPEPISSNNDNKEESSGNAEAKVANDVEQNSVKSTSASTAKLNELALVEKPELLNIDRAQEAQDDYTGSSSIQDLSTEKVHVTKISPDQSVESVHVSLSSDGGQRNGSLTGSKPFHQSNLDAEVKASAPDAYEVTLVGSKTSMSLEAVLHKPERLDKSVRGTSNALGDEVILANPEIYGSSVEPENLLMSPPLKECEDTDWARAEDLVRTGGREEVEVINSSTRGFVVSFGSLIGFLPYRNLAAKHKFLAFESWLRRRGVDPSIFKQNLSIIVSSEDSTKAATPSSSLDPQMDHKVDGEISSTDKLEDLLMIYDQEKLKFLSSFVGQKFKVNVILADRKSRKLIFSVKPKEKEELVEKKRILMAKMRIGDVVKCCIKKITYFGIFVEVEGVPALIHQTEVSWDATLDPAAYFKIGQIVEAKVHQLDFSVERIFLSLKDITPDPLIEAMEAVVGDHDSLARELASAEADTEWHDVEKLIKELQQFKGIKDVSKGRFFLGPGLAPTFQVYMASMLKNQYKLLARAGNRVQEVIVETSLGKEDMKSAILTCTNRVE